MPGREKESFRSHRPQAAQFRERSRPLAPRKPRTASPKCTKGYLHPRLRAEAPQTAVAAASAAPPPLCSRPTVGPCSRIVSQRFSRWMTSAQDGENVLCLAETVIDPHPGIRRKKKEDSSCCILFDHQNSGHSEPQDHGSGEQPSGITSTTGYKPPQLSGKVEN